MSAGALIPPKGEGAEALSESEYKTLKSILAIVRAGWYVSLNVVIEEAQLFAELNDLNVSMLRFMGHLLQEASTRSREAWVDGALVCMGETGFFLNDKREYDRLADYLKVVRSGGWLAEWLACEIGTVATGGRPTPTPLQVAEYLAVYIGEFQEKLIVAQRMAAEFPDLVMPKTAAAEGSPEEVVGKVLPIA